VGHSAAHEFHRVAASFQHQFGCIVQRGKPVEILSTKEVLTMTGLPRSTFYWLRSEGRFPEPARICKTLNVFWRSDEIAAWLRLNPQGVRRPHKD
jgi:predicted DNA-binding transcriptional regulator AlpA